MRRVSYILSYLAAVAIFLYFFPKIISALGNPVKISTSTNQTVFPQTVADSNGYLHLVWMEVATETEIWGGHQNPGILYSRWNGDTWSAPLKISENTGFAEIPALAADSGNTLHVVWDDETYGASGRVAYKTRTSGGTWSAIESLPLPTGALFAWNSRVATDNTNAPHVAFSSGTAGVGDSIYWTRKVSGAWATPELLSKDAASNNLTDCQWSDLRQNSSGTNLYLIYWCFGSGIWYRSYSAGTWSTPFQVTAAGNIEYVRMAATPAGEVFVTWFEVHDTSVRVRWTQGGGIWQAEATLSSVGVRSFWGFPIIGATADSKEKVYVVSVERDVTDGKVDVLYRTFQSGIWGSPQDVDLNNLDADEPIVYADKLDNLHSLWTEQESGTGLWQIYYNSILADTSPPVITITTPQPFAVLPKGTALDFTATDDLSGVKSVVGKLCDQESCTNVSSGFIPNTGVYDLTVEAEDNAGNKATSGPVFFAIYDPAAGSASGAGRFIPGGATSDPGDLLPDLDDTSAAQFGFQVKYTQPGATTPTGSLQFRYQQGNFSLLSNTMEWLVINNNLAKFQGKATISGQTGDFPFRLEARDGNFGGGTQPDRFVIKIWASGSNPDLDNPIHKASGDLVTGNIVIHTQ